MFLKTDRQMKAAIGDKSSIPIGGIIFLKGAKKNSLKDFIARNGSVCQFMLGNQVNKMVTKRTKVTKSNILATPAAIPIFTT